MVEEEGNLEGRQGGNMRIWRGYEGEGQRSGI